MERKREMAEILKEVEVLLRENNFEKIKKYKEELRDYEKDLRIGEISEEEEQRLWYISMVISNRYFILKNKEIFNIRDYMYNREFLRYQLKRDKELREFYENIKVKKEKNEKKLLYEENLKTIDMTKEKIAKYFEKFQNIEEVAKEIRRLDKKLEKLWKIADTKGIGSTEKYRILYKIDAVSQKILILENLHVNSKIYYVDLLIKYYQELKQQINKFYKKLKITKEIKREKERLNKEINNLIKLAGKIPAVS